MKKELDIISLNGFLYGVDASIRAKKGWNYNAALKRIFKFEYDYEEHTTEWNYCFAVICSTDHSLFLPLLPPFEENVIHVPDLKSSEIKGKLYLQAKGMELSSKIAEYRPSHIFDSYKEGFEDGIYYQKSVASAKKYTEEDLRKAFETGVIHGTNPESLNDDVEFVQFIKTLTPTPKKVVIEMEDINIGVDESGNNYITEERPIVKNGFVKVIRWVF